MNATFSWAGSHAATNSSRSLLIVCICITVLQTVSLVSFLTSWCLNRKSHHRLNTVFFLILIGYVVCFGGVVIGILKITIGEGRHGGPSLQPHTTPTTLQLFKAHEFVYATSILFPKLALLYLYRNMLTSLTMRFIIHVAIIFVIATFIFAIVIASINCRPFAASWNINVQGHCTIDPTTAFRYYSIPNIVSGAMLVIFPLLVLRKVRVEAVIKTGFCFTLLLLACGIFVAVLRLISISDGRIYKDITYLIVPNMSWTIIEPALYVIAATIPTLRPLVQYLSGKTSKSLTKGASRMSFPRQSLGFNTLDAKISHPTRVLRKKSSQSLYLHLAETVGRRLSKIMPVDGRNDMQEHSLMTFRSMDEESLVCADAVTHERYAKEGRNPDGTLRTWSLMQPVPLSPLRTSFFLEDLKVPTPVQIARRSIEAAMIPRYWTSGCNSPRYSKSMQTITTPVAAEQLPRSERRQ